MSKKNKRFDSVLKVLEAEFSKYERLTLTQATGILNQLKDPNVSNKDELRNNLINGSLYLVVNTIKRINLPETIECASFDYNDFVQNAVMNWITAIDECVLGERELKSTFKNAYRVVLSIDLFDENVIQHQETIVHSYNLGSYPYTLQQYEESNRPSAGAFGMCIEDFYQNRKMWERGNLEELAEHLCTSMDIIRCCYNAVINCAHILDDNHDTINVSGIRGDYLYDLLYKSSLEFNHHNIEHTDSYDGEDIIVNEIAIKDRDKKLIESLDTLTPRQKEAIVKHFGLLDEDVHTYEEIGKDMNITGSRVGQYEKKGLRCLRHPSRSNSFRLN